MDRPTLEDVDAEQKEKNKKHFWKKLFFEDEVLVSLFAIRRSTFGAKLVYSAHQDASL